MKKIIDRLQGSMIVLHGPPKVGKSQLASRFPSPHCWIATEFGHKFIPQENKQELTQLLPDTGWDTFRQFVRTHRPKKQKTYIVDTASGLYDLCMKWVGNKEGWEYPPANDHGKGWAAVKREFFDALSRLVAHTNSINATLIMIDHSKQETIETTTEKYDKVTCAMSGQARGVIMPIPDHIWFLGYGEKNTKDALKNTISKRALFIGGDNTVEAGTRDASVTTKIIMPLSKKDPHMQILQTLYGEETE